MNLSVGIVGLPNVGKSTLFNALLKKQQALAANYPFATIEPNIGIVPVPDPRLQKLAEIVALEEAGPAAPHPHPTSSSLLRAIDGGPPVASPASLPPIKPTTVEFVDIAGLVKGASVGEGLGNKFLSHIREVKIICHVVRVFEDSEVIREGSLDPRLPSPEGEVNGGQAKSDYETIQTELILADLQTVSKQRETKAVKTDPVKKVAVEALYRGLNEGKPAREIRLDKREKESVNDLFLLSDKPEIIVLNVSEGDYSEKNIPGILNNYAGILEIQKEKMVVICAKVESELSELTEDEQREYLKDLGLEQSGLERLIQKAYEELGLISFLTAGEKEVRAWTIEKGIDAQNAAGVIHTDFIKKFIKAEVVAYDDYISIGGRKKAREIGKARLEGRDYIIQDGDVVEFKIGT